MTPPSTAVAAIPERPALAPWCRVVSDHGRLLVEHGETVVTFEGGGAATLLPALLPLLDGSRTVPEIVGALGGPVAPAVARALSLLAENNLLQDGSPPPDGDPATAAALFAAAVTRRVAPAAAHRAITEATIGIVGSGELASEIARQLEATGARGVASLDAGEAGDGTFVVAAPDRHEVGLLDDVNTRRSQSERAWLQVLPYDGRHVVVGPVFLPGTSACLACFALRRAACSGYEDDFERIEAEPTRASAPFALTAIASGIACLLTLRFVAAGDPSLPGRFYALETGAVLRLTSHAVLRVPRCPVCGPATGRAVPLPWFREAS